MNLQLSEDELNIVLEIQRKYPYVFYAFGSRVKNQATKFSDLDILIKEDVPLDILSLIKEDFEESNLPFTVDVVLARHCTADFLNRIGPDLTPLSIFFPKNA